MKQHSSLLASIGLAAAIVPATASAATFVQYNDRTAFTGAAGSVKTETFNDVTSDRNLETAYDAGDFTMTINRTSGTLGSAAVDAAPFDGSGINGTSYVSAAVYNFSGAYTSLVFTFDEAVTAFGVNLASGASNRAEMLVDGVLVEGGALSAGGFFGFTSDTAFKRIELRAREGSGYSYSLDNVTYSNLAVPEPGTWAMMIGGFGLIGGAMRRRRAPRHAIGCA